MEGEGEAQIRRPSERADGCGPVGAEIFHVDVSPIPQVGGKEGGNDTQVRHARQLIPAHQLGVDHHRPDGGGRQPGLLGGPGGTAEILFGGGVPVAVGQNLAALPEGLRHKGGYSFIRVGRIAAVPVFTSGIGLQHPGSPPLGRAVEKNLVASDAGASGQLRSAGHVGVADNIHRQPSPGQQGIAALVSETVLNQSDTVREVDLFSSFQILDCLCRGRRGDLGADGVKGCLFQVAAGGPAVRAPADTASGGIWSAGADAHCAERGAIGNPHMAGCVGDEYRTVGESTIQDFLSRMGALIQHVVIVSKAYHPAAGWNVPVMPEIFQSG